MTTKSTGVRRAARVGLSNLPLCYPRPGLARISLGRFVVWAQDPLFVSGRHRRTFRMSDCREIFASGQLSLNGQASVLPILICIYGSYCQRSGEIMRRLSALYAAAALATTTVLAIPAPSRADNGQVAAGIIGGLAVGTLFGAAVAQPRYYAPQPVYIVPPPSCYWTRGRPVWDDYRGIWIRPRIQVCD